MLQSAPATDARASVAKISSRSSIHLSGDVILLSGTRRLVESTHFAVQISDKDLHLLLVASSLEESNEMERLVAVMREKHSLQLSKLSTATLVCPFRADEDCIQLLKSVKKQHQHVAVSYTRLY